MTEKNYADQLKEIFDTKFELGFEPPVVFIDTHYNKSNPEELAAFERESEKLWKISVNRKPFECLACIHSRSSTTSLSAIRTTRRNTRRRSRKSS